MLSPGGLFPRISEYRSPEAGNHSRHERQHCVIIPSPISSLTNGMLSAFKNLNLYIIVLYPGCPRTLKNAFRVDTGGCRDSFPKSDVKFHDTFH